MRAALPAAFLPNRPHFDADSIDSAIPRPLAFRPYGFASLANVSDGSRREMITPPSQSEGNAARTHLFSDIAGLWRQLTGSQSVPLYRSVVAQRTLCATAIGSFREDHPAHFGHEQAFDK